MDEKEKIQIGSFVRWKSSHKEKTGVVVEVVRSGWLPDEKYKRIYNNGAGPGKRRDHESFVVAVKTPESVHHYWPRVKWLKEVSEEITQEKNQLIARITETEWKSFSVEFLRKINALLP